LNLCPFYDDTADEGCTQMRAIAWLWIVAVAFFTLAAGARQAASQALAIDQGPDWTAAVRNDFYTRDRGRGSCP
jgi:hypothetical protein